VTPYNAYPTTHNHNATGTIYVHVSGENKTSQDFTFFYTLLFLVALHAWLVLIWNNNLRIV